MLTMIKRCDQRTWSEASSRRRPPSFASLSSGPAFALPPTHRGWVSFKRALVGQFYAGVDSPGRSEAELSGYLRTLRGRDKVRVVCIDLSSSYRSMIKRWFPQAVIVADRFHAIRLVGLHLLRLARQLVPQLGWNRGWLGLLRARGDRLEAERRRRLQRLLAEHPALTGVYEIKERLWRVLRHKRCSKRVCSYHIRELLYLIATLRQSPFEPALTLAKTIEDWQEEIVRMWRFSRNNGVTEGFHRKMKLIQRRAYGFRSFQNYRLRVIAQCG